MWAPGTLVICVDADAIANSRNNIGHGFADYGYATPTQGAVYTVRHAFRDPQDDELRVLLEEIRNPPRNWLRGVYEAGFYASRFRPVSEAHRKIVRDLLAPVPPVEEEIARAVREEVGAP